MKQIREIIRLHVECKLSNRKIAKALGISRPVVSEYLKSFERAQITLKELEHFSDDDLLKLLTKKKNILADKRYLTLEENFKRFSKELKRKGVTLQLLWEEYIEKHPDGYQYSQFCHHYHVWREATDVRMHIEYKAGDKMFVDFTGHKMKIFNEKEKKFYHVETFVAILGASQYTYVEATRSQTKQDFIAANVNALYFFGGVPRAVTPDCLKSGVIKGDNYEPDLNQDYLDYARHHRMAILPARPYKPRDKPLAENMVKIVYQRIFAPLRDRIFTSLEELNEEIMVKLDELNDREMRKYGQSRKQLFEAIEKDVLQPLPLQKYQYRSFFKTKVGFNYHIYLKEDKHYYSAPHKLKGKEICVFYTNTDVEMYYKNVRVASFKRDFRPTEYSTKKEHMPAHHRFYAEWNPERIKKWAGDIGPNVKELSEKIMQECDHPEQGFKKCVGIIGLAKKYGKSRVDKACTRAIDYKNYSYWFVKNILLKGMDKIEDPQLHFNLTATISDHKNIRGKKYYEEAHNE